MLNFYKIVIENLSFNRLSSGQHMNKQQWNSVYYTGRIPATLIRELIDHSYELVLNGPRRADKEELESGIY